MNEKPKKRGISHRPTREIWKSLYCRDADASFPPSCRPVILSLSRSVFSAGNRSPPITWLCLSGRQDRPRAACDFVSCTDAYGSVVMMTAPRRPPPRRSPADHISTMEPEQLSSSRRQHQLSRPSPKSPTPPKKPKMNATLLFNNIESSPGVKFCLAGGKKAKSGKRPNDQSVFRPHV